MPESERRSGSLGKVTAFDIPEGDDISQEYSSSRQIAHEYNSPGTVAFRNSMSRAIEQAPKEFLDKEAFKKTTGKTVEETEKGGLEEPFLDPTAAAAGGFGAVGTMSLRQGMKLMPSLGKAVTAGVVGAITDYPIGAATELVEDKSPALALPFNIITGIVSGATLENTLEKGVIKGLKKAGIAFDKSPDMVRRLVADMRLKLSSEVGSIGSKTPGGQKLADELGLDYLGPGDGGLEYFNYNKATIASKGLNKEELIQKMEQVAPYKDRVPGEGKAEVRVYRDEKGELLTEEAPDTETIFKSVVDTLNNEIGAVGDIKNIRKRLDKKTKKITGKQPDLEYKKVVSEALGEIQAEEVAGTKKKILVSIGAKPDTDLKVDRLDVEGLADIELKDKAININLNRIDSEDDLKKVITRVSEIYRDEIQTTRRGVRTNVQTERTANLIGITPETLLKRRKGQAFNAEEALAARRILVSSAENVHGLAQKLQTLEASDADKFEFRKALNLHFAIQSQVSGLTAEAGRALQQFNIKAGTVKSQTLNVKDLLKTLPGDVTIEQMAEAVATMDSVEGVSKAIPKMLRATTKDMFLEAWINGLLSGPQTHMINTLSNSLNAVWQVPERFLAATLGRVLPGEQAIKETEAIHQAYGLIEGFKDGMKSFAQVARTGMPSDEMTKLEMARYKAITAGNVRQLPLIKKLSPNALQEGGVSARAVDLLGETVRLPGRFLMAEDELFKSIGYRMELRAQAFRMASQEGLQGESKAVRMAEIIADPENLAPNVHLAAVDAARYQTFTRPLESKLLGALSTTKNPILKMIVPFVRTPTNILKYAFERTPLAAMSSNVRADIMSGGARRDLALARISMGSMAMSAAAVMAAEGKITGGGPSDPKLQANLRRQGWMPYSIKIGNKYIAYGRLEPLGMLFGLAADYAEISGLAGEELAPEMDNLASAIVMSIGRNATSKTWLRGMSEAVKAMDDPDRYGNRYIQNYGRSLIPSVVAQVERAMSPELEAVYDMSDSIKSRIPGLSKDLPPRRDLWGDKISTQISSGKRSWGEIAYSTISPIYISEGKNSPIDKELTRLKMGVSKPTRKQKILNAPLELTPEMYDDFILLMNNTDLGGKNLKETLNDFIKSPGYKRLSDDAKQDRIRNVFFKARQVGKAKLIEKYPVLIQIAEKWNARLMEANG